MDEGKDSWKVYCCPVHGLDCYCGIDPGNKLHCHCGEAMTEIDGLDPGNSTNAPRSVDLSKFDDIPDLLYDFLCEVIALRKIVARLAVALKEGKR